MRREEAAASGRVIGQNTSLGTSRTGNLWPISDAPPRGARGPPVPARPGVDHRPYDYHPTTVRPANSCRRDLPGDRAQTSSGTCPRCAATRLWPTWPICSLSRVRWRRNVVLDATPSLRRSCRCWPAIGARCSSGSRTRRESWTRFPLTSLGSASGCASVPPPHAAARGAVPARVDRRLWRRAREAIDLCEVFELSEYAAAADLARRQQLFPGPSAGRRGPPRSTPAQMVQ